MNNERIKELALSCGFTIKIGQTDLKPYVYEFARKLQVECATAAPADIDSPEFDKLLEKHAREFTAHSFRYVNDIIGASKSLYGHINAWGNEQYEAGRQDIQDLLDVEREHVSQCVRNLETMRTRAEAAEAALASRPAVDISAVRSAVAQGWCTERNVRKSCDGELAFDIAEAVYALLTKNSSTAPISVLGVTPCAGRNCGVIDGVSHSAECRADHEACAEQPLLLDKVEAPTGCSKAPACCPNNEGYGCDCSATTASTDGLPPLPPHPESQVMQWSELEKSAIQTYARQARADALEEVACAVRKLACGVILINPDTVQDAIRALNKKGGQ